MIKGKRFEFGFLLGPVTNMIANATVHYSLDFGLICF